MYKHAKVDLNSLHGTPTQCWKSLTYYQFQSRDRNQKDAPRTINIVACQAHPDLGRLKLIVCFEPGFLQVCMREGEKQNTNLEKKTN